MLLRKQHLVSQSGVVFIKWHYSALYAAEKGAWKFPAAAGDTVRTGWTHPMGRHAGMGRLRGRRMGTADGYGDSVDSRILPISHMPSHYKSAASALGSQPGNEPNPACRMNPACRGTGRGADGSIYLFGLHIASLAAVRGNTQNQPDKS